MAEVSVYVALITAAAGVVGSAVPLATSVIREDLRDRRRRRQELEGMRVKSCVGLLRTVLELRTSVANIYDYYGDQMAERRAGIRAAAASAEVQAVRVAVLSQRADLGETAQRLARAAARLAEAATASADLKLGASTTAPDFTELDEIVGAFKALILS